MNKKYHPARMAGLCVVTILSNWGVERQSESYVHARVRARHRMPCIHAEIPAAPLMLVISDQDANRPAINVR